MTVAGKKMHVPREVAQTIAIYLMRDWNGPPRRPHRIPWATSGAKGEIERREVYRAKMIGWEIGNQFLRRREMKSGKLLLALPVADVEWLGTNLPRAWPFGGFASLCRIVSHPRRGPKRVWTEEMARRLYNGQHMGEENKRLYRRVLRTALRENPESIDV